MPRLRRSKIVDYTQSWLCYLDVEDLPDLSLSKLRNVGPQNASVGKKRRNLRRLQESLKKMDLLGIAILVARQQK